MNLGLAGIGVSTAGDLATFRGESGSGASGTGAGTIRSLSGVAMM